MRAPFSTMEFLEIANAPSIEHCVAAASFPVGAKMRTRAVHDVGANSSGDQPLPNSCARSSSVNDKVLDAPPLKRASAKACFFSCMA